MAKLLSGTRIYGNATVDTNLIVSGNTVSTSTTTGALLVSGGIGAVGNVTAGNVNATTITATGYVNAQYFKSTNSQGDEGGEMLLSIPQTNTTIAGTGVTIDVYQNKLRIFEQGGTARGGYFDITSLGAGVATNLGAGSATPPSGTATQVQYNNGGSNFGGATSLLYQANGQVIANASITSVSTGTGTMVVTGGIGVSGNVYCGQVYSTNNGNGTNFQIGDDAWLGDINLANTTRLSGVQDGTQAYLVFGNTNALSLGRSGSGALTYQGGFTAQGGLQNTPIGNSTASTGSFTSVTASGQITVNSGNNATAIVNGGTSGTGNIGASGATFNTIFAKATTAQYADLAENYASDVEYEPGTVVVFGGEHEITVTTESHDTRVAGIISTNPAYLMNSGAIGLPVALTGRVPCFVKGPVYKGDVLVTGSTPGTAQKIDNSLYRPGSIIGKALENNLTEDINLIEVVVGRF